MGEGTYDGKRINLVSWYDHAEDGIDKGVRIPPHTTIGYDLELDRQRFTVTDSGIVVVPKGAEIEEKVTA